MNGPCRIFISCVTAEFGSYRDALRRHLASPFRELKIQEDFINGGGTLLEKLDSYIRHCQAMIHLVGSAPGCVAKAAEVEALVDRYPSFCDALPGIFADGVHGGLEISYTQWEAYLALYHRVPCYIYHADETTERDADRRFKTDSISQKAHLERLINSGKDRATSAFCDARDLAIKFLNSITQNGDELYAKSVEASSIEWPQVPTSIDRRIADRTEEVEAFLNLISGKENKRILVIQGPPHRGKSFLLSTMERVALGMGLECACISIKRETPLHDLLWDVTYQLKGVRFSRFQREYDQGLYDRMRTAFIRDLSEASTPIVLFIDSYEQASVDSKGWIEQRLMQHVRHSTSIRLIISGQETPSQEAGSAMHEITTVRELPLIKEHTHWLEYSQHVLELHDYPEDHIKTLVQASLGCPRGISVLLSNLKKQCV